MGGHQGSVKREVAYHIPEGLVLYASGLTTPGGEGESSEHVVGEGVLGPGKGSGKDPVSEEYRLMPYYVQDIVTTTGVTPQIDGFSAEQNRNFPLWWGPGSPLGQDALAKDWGQHTLWLNPPFSIMEPVVRKLREDHAHAIVVAPCWPDKVWWQDLMQMHVWQQTMPRGIQAFELRGRPSRPVKWPVSVFVVCGCPVRCTLQDICKGKVHRGGGLGRACTVAGQYGRKFFGEGEFEEMVERVRYMQLAAMPEVLFLDQNLNEDEEVLEEVAGRLLRAERRIWSVQVASGAPESRTAALEKNLTEALVAEFGDTSLSGEYLPDPL